MRVKTLHVLHGMVEVAGQNSYAVKGLKEIGVDAQCVVYEEHPFRYPYDQSLHIDKTKRSKLPLYAARLLGFLFRSLRRYNVFHFHFGRSILNNVDLWLYRLTKKRVFFEFHGSDLRDYRQFATLTGLPYDAGEETDPKLHRRNARIARAATGIIIHDDELFRYLPEERQDVYVVPLRLNVDAFDMAVPQKSSDRIRVVHAPSKRAVKGTEFVLNAFERLRGKYDNVDFVLVEGKSQEEAIQIYKTADIIVDQLFVGTYGVFALECMALGKPVITCIRDEMRDLLPKDLPIVSANKDTIERALERLIQNEDERIRCGQQGRAYVEKYHDYRKIAHILRNIYEGKEKPLSGRAAFERVTQIPSETGESALG